MVRGRWLVLPGVWLVVSDLVVALVVVPSSSVVSGLVVALVVVGRLVCRLVAVTAPAVDGLVVVARAQVLVEDGAVRAVERVLLAVGVAEVVDLQLESQPFESRSHL